MSNPDMKIDPNENNCKVNKADEAVNLIHNFSCSQVMERQSAPMRTWVTVLHQIMLNSAFKHHNFSPMSAYCSLMAMMPYINSVENF